MRATGIGRPSTLRGIETNTPHWGNCYHQFQYRKAFHPSGYWNTVDTGFEAINITSVSEGLPPFGVLKHKHDTATVISGIGGIGRPSTLRGIETENLSIIIKLRVLSNRRPSTLRGIETILIACLPVSEYHVIEGLLPFGVLKRLGWWCIHHRSRYVIEGLLPFGVLKLSASCWSQLGSCGNRRPSTLRGIETFLPFNKRDWKMLCNRRPSTLRGIETLDFDFSIFSERYKVIEGLLPFGVLKPNCMSYSVNLQMHS